MRRSLALTSLITGLSSPDRKPTKMTNKQLFGTPKRWGLAILAIAGTFSALGSPAHATTWFDFDDRPGAINISSDSQNPTIINQVTVVCPAAGFVVARSSSTAFLRNLVGTKSTGFVVFSISIDGKRAIGNDAVVVQNLGPNTFANIPASVQRIDACNAGQTITYFHTVHGFAGLGNQVATEGRSKLVVEYFNRRI
ncbi:MAG: hypothetical protein KME17_06995 [Cyanosarcina radialis HA8281-LM2]|jgi:hypothetical protein|nr:hypothetical protein [Cyanosarcina radialis HA8281-LM2]